MTYRFRPFRSVERPVPPPIATTRSSGPGLPVLDELVSIWGSIRLNGSELSQRFLQQKKGDVKGTHSAAPSWRPSTNGFARLTYAHPPASSVMRQTDRRLPVKPISSVVLCVPCGKAFDFLAKTKTHTSSSRTI